MDLEPSFDTKDLARKLNDELAPMAARIGRSLPDMIRTAGRSLARELATKTQPWGLSTTALNKVKTTAGNDLARVYITPSQVYQSIKTGARTKGSQSPETVARAFIAAISSGNTARAQRILQSPGLDQRGQWATLTIGPFDGGAAHRKLRSRSTGRVPKGTKGAMILTNSQGLKDYKDALLDQRAGAGKAAWAAVADQLESTTGFPAWLVRISEGKGHVEDHLSDQEPSVTLVADLPYSSAILAEADIRGAVARTVSKMEKMTRVILEKAVPKS